MWRSAFRENPNRRMENFKIDVRFPNFGLGSLDKGTAEALQKIRDSGVDEKKQYQAEIEATRRHYKTLLHTDYAWVLRKHNIAIDKVEEFIDSHEFTQIPNIDIFANFGVKIWLTKRVSVELRVIIMTLSFFRCIYRIAMSSRPITI